MMITPTPYFVPTSTFKESTPGMIDNPMIPIFLGLGCLILISLSILGIIAAGVWINRRRRKGEDPFQNA
jgi:hypothetical protein